MMKLFDIFKKGEKQDNKNGQQAKEQYEAGLKFAAAKDTAKALECFKEAALSDYAPAQFEIGNAYAMGIGIPAEMNKAVHWFTRSAEGGYAPAQANLGIFYAGGIGVNQDAAEALKWFTKAAEQGYAPAQNNLGRAYLNGDIVKKDLNKALEWFKKAAAQGDKNAQEAVDYIEINVMGFEFSVLKAIEGHLENMGDCKFLNGTTPLLVYKYPMCSFPMIFSVVKGDVLMLSIFKPVGDDMKLLHMEHKNLYGDIPEAVEIFSMVQKASSAVFGEF